MNKIHVDIQLRRFLMVVFLMGTVWMLSACTTTSIENAVFTNESKDTFEEFLDLYDQYYSRMRSYYYATYNNDPYQYDPDFVPLPNQFEDVYRHELYNYHLTDDRIGYDYSTMGNMIDSIRFANYRTNCLDYKEGEDCLESEDYIMRYYVEGDSILLEVTKADDTFHYIFYGFQENLQNSIYYYIKDVTNGTYEYHQGLYVAGQFEWSMENHYQIQYHDIENDLMYTFKNLDETPTVTVMDNPNQESYSINDFGDYKLVQYQQYRNNKMLIDIYSDYRRMTINLSEISGWDRLVKTEDSFDTYQLYYNGSVISEPFVSQLENESGKLEITFDTMYDWSHINNVEEITDAMISLNIIGLETEYSKAMLEPIFLEIEDLYPDILTETGYQDGDDFIDDYYDIPFGLLQFFGYIEK